MKNKLIASGSVVAIATVLVIQAILVNYTTIPEVFATYWLGFENISIVIALGTLVGIAHIAFAIWATAKNKIEWHWAIPLAMMPFMIGAIVQGLLY
ncbi:MAG: hypothetical protein ACI857_002197 [Arenicella sp.]|jgi:hypothetical protein